MADGTTKKPFPTKTVALTGVAAIFIWTAIGFSWFGYGFGWTTGGSAQSMVKESGEATGKVLVAAGVLTPVCVANADADADKVPKLAKVAKESSDYRRKSEMVKTGWAAMEGVELSSSDQNKLAELCMEELLPV